MNTTHLDQFTGALHTPGPWDIMEGKTLLHIETANTGDGKPCGVPICSVPKKCVGNAALIAAAPELLEALVDFNAFYNDLTKSNPGFMGKLCLQDYGTWNEALFKTERVFNKLGMSASAGKATGDDGQVHGSPLTAVTQVKGGAK